MIGRVDSSGRATVEILIAAGSDIQPRAIDVWVDTGFTGDLVIPRGVVDSLHTAAIRNSRRDPRGWHRSSLSDIPLRDSLVRQAEHA